MKNIYIINGIARAGKDTFVQLVQELSKTPTLNLSSVQTLKDLFTKHLNYNEETKTEKERKLLSETKKLFDEHCNFTTFDIVKKLSNDIDNEIAFIHVREPQTFPFLIQQISKNLNITPKTIFISRDQTNLIISNESDKLALTSEYNYDYHITNNSTIDSLKQQAQNFITLESLNMNPQPTNLIHSLLKYKSIQQIEAFLQTINITFDYDQTITTHKADNIIKQLIKHKCNVHILTNRYDDLHKHLFTPHPSNHDLHNTANKLGITSKIFLNAVSIQSGNEITTDKEAKAKFLQNSNVLIHVEDDLEQIHHIHSKTKTIPLSINKTNLTQKIITILTKKLKEYYNQYDLKLLQPYINQTFYDPEKNLYITIKDITTSKQKDILFITEEARVLNSSEEETEDDLYSDVIGVVKFNNALRKPNYVLTQQLNDTLEAKQQKAMEEIKEKIQGIEVGTWYKYYSESCFEVHTDSHIYAITIHDQTNIHEHLTAFSKRKKTDRDKTIIAPPTQTETTKGEVMAYIINPL